MNNEQQAVIIVGSSRPDGNTTKIATTLAKNNNWEVVNLSDYNFSYYDYEDKNIDDDYLPLMTKIIKNYDTLIFATPVYWYNMSGIMKVFFDRFSVLLRTKKDLGRALRGKNMVVVSNNHNDDIDDTFFIPFKKSADYLGMNFLGHQHYNADKKTFETLNLKF